MECFITFIFNRISVNRRLWTWNEWKMQCHHGTGYCWCVTPDGKPIPGSSIRHTKPNCKRQSKFQLFFFILRRFFYYQLLTHFKINKLSATHLAGKSSPSRRSPQGKKPRKGKSGKSGKKFHHFSFKCFQLSEFFSAK